MKNSMLVAAMVLGLAGSSFAQMSGSQLINVDVSILKALTITAYGNASFGSTYAGVGSITLTPATPGSGQTAGRFAVNGEPGRTITVSYLYASPSVTGATVVYTPSIVGLNTNTQASATTFGSSVSLDATTGDYYFWVGGTMTGISASAQSGTYNGTFTLQIAY